jgi:hypothetical protein
MEEPCKNVIMNTYKHVKVFIQDVPIIFVRRVERIVQM